MNTVTTTTGQSPALVYVSNKRYLYLGRTQLRIRDFHSGASSLVVCLEGTMKFRMANESRWISAKSMLISAGSRVSIDNQGAIISSCYLDAAKPDFQTIRKQMESLHGGIYYKHENECQLIQSLLRLREDAPGLSEAQQRLESIIYPCAVEGTCNIDPRVRHTVERLRNTAAQNIPVSALAEEVGLSASGLIRLFSQHVGAPLRKHRLWYRLIDFVVLSLSGVPSTSAIRAAGFTDTAHLSRCYSGFFGVNFSYAFSKNTNVRYIYTDEPRQNLLHLPPPAQAYTPSVMAAPL